VFVGMIFFIWNIIDTIVTKIRHDDLWNPH
jgi:hypothetical protein